MITRDHPLSLPDRPGMSQVVIKERFFSETNLHRKEDSMADKKLEGMRIAILVTDDFEQIELTEPKKAFEDQGAVVTLVAPHSGAVQGFNHDQKGETFSVDLSLDEAKADKFDALLLPGGALNADALRVVPEAQEFVRAIDRAQTPIAVICHGPWLLASAGLVRGRGLTSYHTIQDDMKNAGALWQDSETVRDRNWVSSRRPKDIPAFNRAAVELMAEYRQRVKQRAA
jgi:protease I